MDRITGPTDLVTRLEGMTDKLAAHEKLPLMTTGYPARSADLVSQIHSELNDLIAHLKEPGKGVNPVTIPGVNPQTGQKKNVSIARIWLDTPAKTVSDGQQRAGIGVPPVEERHKDVTLVVWDGPPEKPNILQVLKISEHDFVQALAQVFPLRELWVESGASKVNADLLIRMLRGQS